MKLIFSVLSAASFFLCQGQTKYDALETNADNNTLLWEVSGNGLSQPSYIFGTFHLMCKDDIHFSDALQRVFAKADEVYMELDMDDPAEMMGGLKLMNMKDGKTLKDLYTDAAYEKVNNFFKDSLQMPLSFIPGMKPFFLMALLYPKMLACKNVSGIEQALIKIAKEQKKAIKGLETMEFQSAVFDSIPYEQQARDLLKAIDSIGAYRVYFDKMLQVYKNQELDKIESLFTDTTFGMQDQQDILLDKRNKNWADKLKAILQAKSVFIAVGAGHLPGEKGLLNLLRNDGYTVQPLGNK